MQTPSHGQPLTLSPGPQLLLDDLLVEDRFRLTRTLQHPSKHPNNPILMRDTPWEGEIQQIASVMYDDEAGIYRMWYGTASMQRYYSRGASQGYQALCYAESDDAYTWRKPRLDLCPSGKHAQTNILHWGSLRPMLNPDASDPQRRFLGVGLYFREHPSGVRNDGINLLHSADGLHWDMDNDWHIFDHHSDTKNQLVYDARHQRWLLYCRPSIYASGRDHLHDRHHRRRVCVMVSSDLREWSYPEVVMYPDEGDLPDYDHMQVFAYGSHLLMHYIAMDGDDTGRMHMRLASSGDGIRWTRFHGYEDILPFGPPGAFDAGIIGAASHPLRQDDKLLLYYNGMNLGQHESFPASMERIGGGGLSIMKADRFVAQRAGEQEGWLLTRCFILEGNNLTLNMATDSRPGRTGSIQVEVVRRPPRDGHTDYYLAEYEQKGYTHAWDNFQLHACPKLSGDRIDQPVRWQGRDLSELVGQPVYLRFRLQNADLYSFSISSD